MVEKKVKEAERLQKIRTQSKKGKDTEDERKEDKGIQGENSPVDILGNNDDNNKKTTQKEHVEMGNDKQRNITAEKGNKEIRKSKQGREEHEGEDLCNEARLVAEAQA